MKKISYILSAAAIAMAGLTSCTLDAINYTEKDTSNFPLTSEDADQALAGIYQNLNVPNATPQCSFYYVAQLAGDDALGGGGENDMLMQAYDFMVLSRDLDVKMEFGGNDCDFNWKEISDHPDRGHPPANTIVNFRTTYIRMIRAIKSTGKMPVLLSLPPVDPSRYFEHISRNRSKDNIRRWLQNDIQFIANWHEIYNIEIFMLGQTCQIPVIDITSVFLERKNYTTCLCSDGIHPNVEGHKLIADMLLSYVSSHRITFS